VGLIAEKYAPLTVGALTFLANIGWFRFALLDHTDWANRLLDRVIQASSVGFAFWGIAITLLIGMESKPVVVTLRKIGYLGFIVRYFSEALFATFFLLVGSALLEPLSKRLWPMGLSSAWLAIAVWALLTTLRSFVTLTNILARLE